MFGIPIEVLAAVAGLFVGGGGVAYRLKGNRSFLRTLRDVVIRPQSGGGPGSPPRGQDDPGP